MVDDMSLGYANARHAKALTLCIGECPPVTSSLDRLKVDSPCEKELRPHPLPPPPGDPIGIIYGRRKKLDVLLDSKVWATTR